MAVLAADPPKQLSHDHDPSWRCTMASGRSAARAAFAYQRGQSFLVLGRRPWGLTVGHARLAARSIA
jgi:hypothetical protein